MGIEVEFKVEGARCSMACCLVAHVYIYSKTKQNQKFKNGNFPCRPPGSEVGLRLGDEDKYFWGKK